jgi:K+-sensing histidine kinase KdpD
MMRNWTINFGNSSAWLGGIARQLAGRQAVSPRSGRVRRMIKPDPPQRPKPRALSYHAMAVLSVGVAIVAAELIARQLHAEAIASLMLCAVIFSAWFGGFGPALVAIALAVLAFHYYVVPPSIRSPGSIV